MCDVHGPKYTDVANPRGLRKSFIVLSLLASAALIPASAQDASSPPAPAVESKPDESTLSLSGTVINSLTGEPIHRAVVSLQSGQASFSTFSDSSGHFEFTGLPEGRAFLNAARPGFGANRYPGFSGTTVQVTHTTTPVVLKIAPDGTISGKLTSRDGQPLEGYTLRLISPSSMGGLRRWSFSSQSTTDDEGRFRMTGLFPDTYYLELEQNQATTLSQRGVANAREQVYAKVFYPGVPDVDAASPIDVRAGGEIEVNLSLAAEPLFDVSGIVSAADAVTSPLQFSRRSGGGYDFAETGAAPDAGRFQVKLPAGIYSVKAGTAAGVYLVADDLVVSADNANVQVALSPIPSIPVNVRSERTAGSPAADGPAQTAEMGMSLQLMSEGFQQPSYFWAPAQGNGIQNVEPGTYSVNVNLPPGPWWLQSVRSGNIDLLSDNLTVAEGSQTPSIEITLRDDGGTVRGTVPLNDGILPPTALLVQPYGKRNLIKVAPAIQGKFEFDGVAPGEHLAIAIDPSDPIDYENPNVLAPYLSMAQRVSVQSRGVATVNLSVSTTER
jgi:hypothetical protein